MQERVLKVTYFTNYRKIACGLALVVVLGGCSEKPFSVVVNSTLEDISSYEYDYYSGQNAAVRQFGKDSDIDLVVDLDNKRVVSYASDSDHQGYADGYHKALDIIDSRNNPKCPDFH